MDVQTRGRFKYPQVKMYNTPPHDMKDKLKSYMQIFDICNQNVKNKITDPQNDLDEYFLK